MKDRINHNRQVYFLIGVIIKAIKQTKPLLWVGMTKMGQTL